MIEKESRPHHEATPHNTLALQRTGAPGFPSTVAWQRRQFLHAVRASHRNTRELDVLCGLERPVPVALGSDPYRDSGLVLDHLERAAAGRLLKVAA